jgi:hypothetical protein
METQNESGTQEAGTVEATTTATDDKATKGILADLQREREAGKAAKAEAEALRAWRAEHEPKLGELDALRGKLGEFETREAARVAAKVAENEAALAALPEELRELVPPGLDPEALSAHLGRLAKRAASISTGTVVRGGSLPGVTAEMKAWFEKNRVPEASRNVEFYHQCNPPKK